MLHLIITVSCSNAGLSECRVWTQRISPDVRWYKSPTPHPQQHADTCEAVGDNDATVCVAGHSCLYGPCSAAAMSVRPEYVSAQACVRWCVHKSTAGAQWIVRRCLRRVLWIVYDTSRHAARNRYLLPVPAACSCSCRLGMLEC